jgi:hypothetical protein
VHLPAFYEKLEIIVGFVLPDSEALFGELPNCFPGNGV